MKHAGTPFKHALAMMAAIQAAMQSVNPQFAMSQIGPYRSRGKGRGKAFDKQRYGNKAGKYMPHQGERECARRRGELVRGAA